MSNFAGMAIETGVVLPAGRWPVPASACVAALAFLNIAALDLATSACAQQGEAAGINIGFTLSALKPGEVPAAGRDAGFAVTLTTGMAGAPLRGAKPAAWLVPRASGAPLDERQCRIMAASLVRGATLTVPALDLNSFYILSLADNASVAVIDPRHGFGGSRLIGMATFDAPASDWALHADQSVLALAEPAADQISLVDTKDWSRKARIGLPNPTRVALTPDGRTLIASYHAAPRGAAPESGVALIDLSAPTAVPLRIATGAGAHDIAIDAEGRFAFVGNAGADSVSVIDLAMRRNAVTIKTGRRPIALAYSALARRLYAAAEDGSLTVIGGEPFAPLAVIGGPRGIATLRFAPGGRFLLAASPTAGEVIVIDTATDRIVQRFAVAGQPDAIGFSDRVAYIRHRANEFVEAIPLDQIGVEGRRPVGVSVGAGRLALGAVSTPARADVMVPIPNGDGMLISNPGDRAIYLYYEGMSAPSSSFSTYGREPRAVQILDRRLREIEPGVYRTIGRLPGAGLYDLVVYLDAPRIVHCFELRVDPDPAAGNTAALPPAVADMAIADAPRAGRPLPLRFRLVDAQSGVPVSDVEDARVLSFRMPGTDAVRSAARALGNGSYEAEITLPAPGNYYVFVEAPSVALAPTAGRLVAVAP
jgi:YVTN family beta-propeller protein